MPNVPRTLIVADCEQVLHVAQLNLRMRIQSLEIVLHQVSCHDVSCEIQNSAFDLPTKLSFPHDKIDFDHTFVMNQVENGFVRESVAHESVFNLIHHESVIKVDFIVRKQNEYRRVEFERRQKVSILDFTTYIVSKEDLIISKLWWAKDSHSEIQLGDVKNLLAIGYDREYVERWTHELGLNNLLQECLHD